MSVENQNLSDHIEELGKVFEKFEFSPIQGRILAYLSAAEPPHRSFNEIVYFFHASKSTISTALSYLISRKVVDYKTFSNDRKRYFFITDAIPEVFFTTQLETLGYLRELSFKTLSMRTSAYPEVNSIIHQWIEMSNHYQELIRKLKDQLRNEKS